jgi:hypothetical protein
VSIIGFEHFKWKKVISFLSSRDHVFTNLPSIVIAPSIAQLRWSYSLAKETESQILDDFKRKKKILQVLFDKTIRKGWASRMKCGACEQGLALVEGYVLFNRIF